MVLDEDALEAMLARGKGAEAPPAEMVTTDETDEFEVYERKAEPEAEHVHEVPSEPMAWEAPAEANDEFEVFERAAPLQEAPDAREAPVEPHFEEPEAAPEPTPQPAPEPAPRRRPEVWPPIRNRTASTAAPEPVAAPVAQPESPRTHAPEPQVQPAVVTGQGARIAIVQATFNIELTDMMVELAKQKAAKLGANVLAVDQCAGVYDLPLPTKRLLAREDVDGVVVIGVVVQGETKHDEIITHATAKTLQELSLQFDKPVGLAVTGPGMTWKQAEARVANAAHGVEAVLTLLHNKV